MTIQVCTVLLTIRLNCHVGNRVVTWNQVLNLADQVMSIHCNVFGEIQYFSVSSAVSKMLDEFPGQDNSS